MHELFSCDMNIVWPRQFANLPFPDEIYQSRFCQIRPAVVNSPKSFLPVVLCQCQLFLWRFTSNYIRMSLFPEAICQRQFTSISFLGGDLPETVSLVAIYEGQFACDDLPASVFLVVVCKCQFSQCRFPSFSFLIVINQCHFSNSDYQCHFFHWWFASVSFPSNDLPVSIFPAVISPVSVFPEAF